MQEIYWLRSQLFAYFRQQEDEFAEAMAYTSRLISTTPINGMEEEELWLRLVSAGFEFQTAIEVTDFIQGKVIE